MCFISDYTTERFKSLEIIWLTVGWNRSDGLCCPPHSVLLSITVTARLVAAVDDADVCVQTQINVCVCVCDRGNGALCAYHSWGQCQLSFRPIIVMDLCPHLGIRKAR